MLRLDRRMAIPLFSVILLGALGQISSAQRESSAAHPIGQRPMEGTRPETVSDGMRVDRPPIVVAPVEFTGCQNKVITFKVTASDPNGDAIQSLAADFSALPEANHAKFKTNATNTVGTFRWTPTFVDARVTPYVVIFTAKSSMSSGSAKTSIIVDDPF